MLTAALKLDDAHIQFIFRFPGLHEPCLRLVACCSIVGQYCHRLRYIAVPLQSATSVGRGKYTRRATAGILLGSPMRLQPLGGSTSRRGA
ncbi:hypothetical protein DAEQUDRAFT_385561 [Daedalea quercina L-15889]|uniref:Uncharacterized protein n=1 Tax=Daedalea quercina L-15889 TaxID=1314783 RepID=A0A165P229_9APHY|nr:hypothetical protein DAEQUDRAFT_385561 [Daedalea quercina L-15889]